MTRARFSLVDYAGPIQRLTLDKAERFAAKGWAFMPKVDGSYVELSTDATGRISRMVFRTGTQLDRGEHDGLLGLSIGLPLSTLVGELEVYSEHAVRTVEGVEVERDGKVRRIPGRGVRHLHVFDMVRHVGQYVAREPFSVRYGRILQWKSAVEAGETYGRWYEDHTGRAHDSITGDFVQHARKNLVRLPIVPIAAGKAGLETLWQSHVEAGGGEGLVAVDLTAPIGRRGAKRKIKHHDYPSVTIVEVGPTGVRALFGSEVFRIPAMRLVRQGAVNVGEIWDVKADGFTDRGLPRFARLVRCRPDLRSNASLAPT